MTERTEEQKKRLDEVIAWLKDGAPHKVLADGSHLNGFAFETWINEDPNDEDNTGQCGTVACIAGAVVQFSEPVEMKKITWYVEPVRNDEGINVEKEAGDLLGLTEYQRELLFYPFDLDAEQLDTRLGYDPEPLSEVFEDHEYNPFWSARNATPQQVARVLQHFQDTGVIDWHQMNEVSDDG